MKRCTEYLFLFSKVHCQYSSDMHRWREVVCRAMGAAQVRHVARMERITAPFYHRSPPAEHQSLILFQALE